MNFYKLQHQCYIDMDEMLRQGMSEDEITYKLSLKYGMSMNNLRRRFELVQRIKDAAAEKSA